MAIKINNILVKSNPSVRPNIFTNIIRSNFNECVLQNSGGASVPVFSGVANHTFTSSTTSSGRCYFILNADVEEGKKYIFKVDLTITGTPTRFVIQIRNITDPVDVYPGLELTPTQSGVHHVVFTATTTETIQIRVGIGCPGNETNNITVQAGKVSLSEFDKQYPEFSPTITFGNGGKGGSCYAMDYQYSESNGILTKVTTPKPYNRPFTCGMFIGDSYSELDHWPQKLVEVDGNMLIQGGSFPGQGINDYRDHVVEILDFDSFNHFGTKPDFFIFQSSINSIDSAETVDTMIDDAAYVIQQAVDRNLFVFATNIILPSTVTLEDRRVKLFDYNYRLVGLCRSKGVRLIDVASHIGNKAQAKIKNEYENSDLLHLSEAGYIKYAELIHSAIVDERKNAYART